MMPASWSEMSHRAKAAFLARMPSTGLVTGVVSTAGGHFIGAIDLHDINFVYNLRLNPDMLGTCGSAKLHAMTMESAGCARPRSVASWMARSLAAMGRGMA